MIFGLRKYTFLVIFFSLLAQNSYSLNVQKTKPKEIKINNNELERIKSDKKDADLQAQKSSLKKQYKNLKKNTRQKPGKETKQNGGESGTDIALKKTAAEFEKLYLQLMWSYADREEGENKSFAHQYWNRELKNSVIDSGHELGQIGQGIYEDLKRSEGKKQKRKSNKKTNNGNKK